MKRSEISACPFNPRKISPYNRRKLRDKIQKTGLLNALVFNRKTGHLLSGHQRLSILDDLEGNDRYEMDVNVVDLPESEEKSMVVFFNNAMQTQGEYDWQQFDDALRAGEIDIEDCGFTLDGLSLVYDETGLEAWFLPGASEEAPAVEELDAIIEEGVDAEQAEEEERNTAEEIEGFRARKKAYDAQQAAENSAHFVLTIIFPDEAHKAAYAKLCGLSLDVKYIDARDLVLAPRVDWEQISDEAQKFADLVKEEYNDDSAGPGEVGDLFSEGEEDESQVETVVSGEEREGSGTKDPQERGGQSAGSGLGEPEDESGSGVPADSEQRAVRSRKKRA
jgi:hypothetical protein